MLLSVSTFAQNFSGTYYIGADGTKPGGGNPDYSLFSQAITALKAGTVTGNCTFLITSNISDSANSGFALPTNGYTITIKPAPGTQDTITFTKTTDNAGCSGAIVLGISDLSSTSYPVIPTSNIIFDGSNTVGGTTRDLVFKTATTAHANTFVFRLFGTVRNIVLKNLVAISNKSNYAIVITNRNASSVNYTPDSILVDNCYISSIVNTTGQALAISNSGTPTAFPNKITFSNNTLVANSRGLFLNYAGNTDVFGNTVLMNQINGGFISTGIFVNAVGSSTDTNYTVKVYNNNIKQLATANSSAGDYGIQGIWLGSKGNMYVYNNMINGFSSTATSAAPNFRFYGMRISGSGQNKVAFNSIYLPDLSYTKTGGTQSYAGFIITGGYDSLVNNIVYSAQTGDTSFAVLYKSTYGSLYAAHNDYYISDTTGFIGIKDSSVWAKSLNNWITATGKDSLSISKQVFFTGANDLHLMGTSIGDQALAGVPLYFASKDYDNQMRDPGKPYIGADEDTAHALPVELASLTANVSGKTVTLNWSTATELNNRGFEVEKNVNGTWSNIGFVKGAGSSTEMHKYSFVDNNVSGKIEYRLKQIDMNGSFSYSKVIAVNATAPVNFDLSQNYPNPFNPTTTIRFSVPQKSNVKLEVYSITGQLVAVLFNGEKNTGRYEISFDASKLASGTYIYKLTNGSSVLAKKMMLIK